MHLLAAGYSQMEAGAAAQSKALTNIEQLQERSQKAANLLQAQAASMEARFKAWQQSGLRQLPPAPPDVPGKGKGGGKGKGDEYSERPLNSKERRSKQWVQNLKDKGKWKGKWS